MAEKNRRDEDDNDRLEDEAIDDVVDDDADDDEDEDEPVSRGGTATRARTKADSADSRPKTMTETGRVGIFGRLARFFREVVAELRKVIWPTRKELLTYTAVVVVFVAVVLTIVAGLDYAFARGVLWVFGGSS
ncbi:preprotein translocase subunit SecE [Plantactinospora soyae]|uniref:Protein translocase subunit SecE n=1 Tax=Plantactinospora soyae TaxID=1544732 RepID=A0A927LZ35_9ACTN|nr:preprotein translocase subunit SecE [Plantactinospora soyae]MBE1485178.1 preprotein translocase subunit SecE [Plantactinospora soyae]